MEGESQKPLKMRKLRREFRLAIRERMTIKKKAIYILKQAGGKGRRQAKSIIMLGQMDGDCLCIRGEGQESSVVRIFECKYPSI